MCSVVGVVVWDEVGAEAHRRPRGRSLTAGGTVLGPEVAGRGGGIGRAGRVLQGDRVLVQDAPRSVHPALET